MIAPLFQPGDLVTWREMFTVRECRGVIEEVRSGVGGTWYMVALVTQDGERRPAKPIAERRLTSAEDRRPVATPPMPVREPVADRAAKFAFGDPVTWLEGRSSRERRGVVELIWYERGFGHTYLVRSLLEDGQPGKQQRQFAEVELSAPKETEADLLPPDELARRMADLKEQLRR